MPGLVETPGATPRQPASARQPSSAPMEEMYGGTRLGRQELDGENDRRTSPAPRVLTVSDHDPARDYQAGLQQARRPGAGETEQRLEMPAAIEAGTAKAIAEAALARAEAGRTTRTVAPGLAGLAVAPGSRVAIVGETGLWRVVDSSAEGYAVTLTLTPLAPAILPATASSGRIVAAADLAIGTTLIEVAELPGLEDQPLAAPRLTIAANGTGPGWRRAALLLSTDDGASWSAAGSTAAPAVIGRLETVPAAAPATLFDEANDLVVTLARADMRPADADAAASSTAGAQFGDGGDGADPVRPRRSRSATTAGGSAGCCADGAGPRPAIGTQTTATGSSCSTATRTRTIDLPLARIGGAGAGDRYRVCGDPDGPVATPVATGRSILPPSPVRHDTVTDGKTAPSPSPGSAAVAPAGAGSTASTRRSPRSRRRIALSRPMRTASSSRSTDRLVPAASRRRIRRAAARVEVRQRGDVRPVGGTDDPAVVPRPAAPHRISHEEPNHDRPDRAVRATAARSGAIAERDDA